MSKTYPPRGGVFRRRLDALQAVDGVTCALRSGEAVGLVGESGCGKTTLARLLVGLLAPTAGCVVMRGAPWARFRGEPLRRARRAVQMVFQDPTGSLNPRMTVEAMVSEPLIVHRVAAGAARRARVDELLETVQLPSAYRRRLPRELSGGERQRVGIARALATDPEVLICDEPIASLDVSVGVRILELLRGLSQRRQMALFFISHDLGAVAFLCQRILVMSQGRLVEEGPTAELIRAPRHPHTQLLLRSATLALDASLAPEIQ